mmetsp:Transcript_12927/g.20303  ORF Transcript_12927/g.20303 Transcript_12927/m.20303 type:complete len:249 (-) Transcript_12927:61-807(-)
MAPQDMRRREVMGKAAIVAAVAGVCLLASCIAVIGWQQQQQSAPDVESMYHMWLGSNGLPLSPRKQRSLLFQFCTTNFVTEAEMRYCYARLLSVGNPSGPVKYQGQPQYDAEQVVSPLFTFSAPPMEEGGEGGEGAEGGAEERAKAPAQLKQVPKVKSQSLALAGNRMIPKLHNEGSAQGEWAEFLEKQKAFQAAIKREKQAQESAQQKRLVHIAAQAKREVSAKKAIHPAELSARGPWYNHQQALAI